MDGLFKDKTVKKLGFQIKRVRRVLKNNKVKIVLTVEEVNKGWEHNVAVTSDVATNINLLYRHVMKAIGGDFRSRKIKDHGWEDWAIKHLTNAPEEDLDASVIDRVEGTIVQMLERVIHLGEDVNESSESYCFMCVGRDWYVKLPAIFTLMRLCKDDLAVAENRINYPKIESNNLMKTSGSRSKKRFKFASFWRKLPEQILHSCRGFHSDIDE